MALPKRRHRGRSRSSHFRPTVELLEPRLYLHRGFHNGGGPDAIIQVEVLTEAGCQPLNGSIVPSMTPEVRISIPENVRVPGRAIHVRLDDYDPTTPFEDVSDDFPDLATTGVGTATLNVELGGHSLQVRAGNYTTSAAMLNVASDSLVVSSPLRHSFEHDQTSNLDFERRIVLLNLVESASFPEISDDLREHELTPLDINVPLQLVRAPFDGNDSAMDVSQRLVDEFDALVEGVMPNIQMNSDADIDVESERMPVRLRNTHRVDADENCNANGMTHHGCFDHTGGIANNELKLFRYHFLMDTFAGHRLVQSLIPNPTQTTSLAIIDTGLGDGDATPNTTDIADADLISPSGTTTAVRALNFNNDGLQVDANNTVINIPLRDLRDLGSDGGHGTSVTMGAVGRGEIALGIGRDVRVRVFRPPTGESANGRVGPDANGAIACLTAVSRDNRLSVVNTSFGAASSALGANALAALWRSYQDAADTLRAAGRIWVPSAGNEGINTSNSAHYPSDLAPGPGPRAAASRLMLSVSSAETIDDLHDPERLRSDSNFGDHISIAGPGGNVVLPRSNGNLSETNGTSIASPHVAGLAAEMIHLDRNIRNPATGALQIIEWLEATADDFGSNVQANTTAKPNDLPGNSWDAAFGHGRINVWKALLAVANGGIANQKLNANNVNEFPNVTVIPEASTTWYGFKIRTSVLGATVWIDGARLTDEGATVPGTPEVTAYAGATPHVESISINRFLLDGGTVPSGNTRGEYVATFSARRSDVVRSDGNAATLSLRRPGEGTDKRPFFNLRLDLAAMRQNQVSGVAFDDFVFEITPANFGDAPDDAAKPDDYPRLVVRNALGSVINNGGRHGNSNLEWLGKAAAVQVDSVSPESNADDRVDVDGVPNFDATRGPLFVDLDRRDDGVQFFPLTYRANASDGKLQFTVSAADPRSGRYADNVDRSLSVNAWIAWQSNGVWEEANDEYIVDRLRINPANTMEQSRRCPEIPGKQRARLRIESH